MKKAFTLAEVLITLVILGIVAAMTIPVLNNYTKDLEYKSKAKKTYSMLSQALGMASLQGYMPKINFSGNSGMTVQTWFNQYLQRHLSTMKVCYNSSGCWNSGKTLYLNRGTVSGYTSGKGIGDSLVGAVLSDGTFISISSYSSSEMQSSFGTTVDGTGAVIFFDVNGEKQPNTVGRDIYAAVYKDGAIMPPFTDSSDKVKNDCSRKGTGFSCLYDIVDKGLQ